MGENGPTIVQLDRNDPAIDAVVAHVDDEHRLLDRWVEHADWVYGAVVGGRVVGIGARVQSPLHPTRDWVTVHVEPSRRRSGVGSTLLHRLRSKRPRTATKVRVPSSQRAGLRFAAVHGYTRLVSSADVMLSTLPSPPMIDGHISAASVDDADFLDALGTLYVVSHRWDPCVGLETPVVRRLLAGDDALPETARVVRRRGEIVGVGIAYAGQSTGRVEMANFGAVHPEAVDGVQITHAILHAVGRQLLDAGGTIAVECDFGPGANTALSDLLVRLVGQPTSAVEILATPPV